MRDAHEGWLSRLTFLCFVVGSSLAAGVIGKLKHHGQASCLLGEMRQQRINEQHNPEQFEHFLERVEKAIGDSRSVVQVGFSSANLYSLIETAKANGIEPYAYLRMIFTALPQATSLEEIEALLPFSADAEKQEVASWIERLQKSEMRVASAAC